MPEFVQLTVEQAKAELDKAGTVKPDADYIAYIKAMQPIGAGEIRVGPNESKRGVTARLNASSKACGIPVYPKRRGENKVFFVYEAPKPRAKKAAKKG